MMRSLLKGGLLTLAIVLLKQVAAADGEFTLEETDDGVVVKLDGELFTKYLKHSGTKPILYPIIGPGGKSMTRAFPMERVRGERPDHPHHRSLWFTHGDVNGVDYWSEVGRGLGKQVHRAFEEVKHGDGKATIAATVDWVDPEGNKVLEDHRRYTFRTDGDARIIDFDITLTALDRPVRFGDTKEGTFGIRIPTSMDVTSRRGGEIVTSENLRDKDAWGKPAAWVDYHGPVDDQKLGIAIMNHPSSFRFPTRWHVRDYGLFAANPFGLKDFPQVEGSGGEHTLQPGESLTLRYRVLLHAGDHEDGRVAERFTQYAESK
jgi:hypothetical protein